MSVLQTIKSELIHCEPNWASKKKIRLNKQEIRINVRHLILLLSFILRLKHLLFLHLPNTFPYLGVKESCSHILPLLSLNLLNSTCIRIWRRFLSLKSSYLLQPRVGLLFCLFFLAILHLHTEKKNYKAKKKKTEGRRTRRRRERKELQFFI